MGWEGLDGLDGLELSMGFAPTAHVKLLIQPLLTLCSPSAHPLRTHTVLRAPRVRWTHPPASRRAPPSRNQVVTSRWMWVRQYPATLPAAPSRCAAAESSRTRYEGFPAHLGVNVRSNTNPPLKPRFRGILGASCDQGTPCSHSTLYPFLIPPLDFGSLWTFGKLDTSSVFWYPYPVQAANPKPSAPIQGGQDRGGRRRGG